ncbi:MAG: polysaccharide biosynthesis/export family protein [Kiritimatiellae bacterium]|nr:polysaccharide biosynthesis/export family protein [Kiritimatiellia bacterium]
MNVRWLTAFVLAGVLAGCATNESRYEHYARIANEAAISGNRPRAEAPAARVPDAEKQRLAEAEKARAAAERKAREAEKAMQEARRAQAKAEAQAQARAEAAEKAAAKAREKQLAAEAKAAKAVGIEEAARAREEARAAREELARQEREAAEAKAAAEEAARPPAPVAVVAPAEVPQADATVFSVGGVILKPQDVVTVVLRGIPAPEQIEDQIDDEGNISLPLIGEVRAAGYNATDLEREIRRRYVDGRIYQNIAVTVIVPSRFYFIQGEVRAPGRYQLVQAIRLSQAIAQAGGYTEFAGKKATITRDGTVFKKVKNTRKLNSRPDDDILLEPGDIVLIERSFW